MPKNAAFSALILVFAVFALANLDPSYDLISTFDEIDPFETEPSISTDESLIADTYGCSSYNGQSASKLRTRRTKNFCTPKKNSNKDPPQSSSTPQIPASYIEYYPKPILETDFKVDRTICPSSIYGSRPFPVCDSGYPDIYNTLVASSMSFNLKFCIPYSLPTGCSQPPTRMTHLSQTKSQLWCCSFIYQEMGYGINDWFAINCRKNTPDAKPLAGYP